VSPQSSLDSNKLGYEVGVRINIDVLNAQQQVFSTRPDLLVASTATIMTISSSRPRPGSLREKTSKSPTRARAPRQDFRSALPAEVPGRHPGAAAWRPCGASHSFFPARPIADLFSGFDRTRPPPGSRRRTGCLNCRAGFHGQPRRLGEVEHARAEHNRHARRAGLDQVLPAVAARTNRRSRPRRPLRSRNPSPPSCPRDARGRSQPASGSRLRRDTGDSSFARNPSLREVRNTSSKRRGCRGTMSTSILSSQAGIAVISLITHIRR